jgi:hypothetical protein
MSDEIIKDYDLIKEIVFGEIKGIRLEQEDGSVVFVGHQDNKPEIVFIGLVNKTTGAVTKFVSSSKKMEMLKRLLTVYFTIKDASGFTDKMLSTFPEGVGYYSFQNKMNIEEFDDRFGHLKENDETIDKN